MQRDNLGREEGWGKRGSCNTRSHCVPSPVSSLAFCLLATLLARVSPPPCLGFFPSPTSNLFGFQPPSTNIAACAMHECLHTLMGVCTHVIVQASRRNQDWPTALWTEECSHHSSWGWEAELVGCEWWDLGRHQAAIPFRCSVHRNNTSTWKPQSDHS